MVCQNSLRVVRQMTVPEYRRHTCAFSLPRERQESVISTLQKVDTAESPYIDSAGMLEPPCHNLRVASGLWRRKGKEGDMPGSHYDVEPGHSVRDHHQSSDQVGGLSYSFSSTKPPLPLNPIGPCLAHRDHSLGGPGFPAH